MHRGGKSDSSSSPASVLSVVHRGELVRFLTRGVFVYRRLSDPQTNKHLLESIDYDDQWYLDAFHSHS